MLNLLDNTIIGKEKEEYYSFLVEKESYSFKMLESSSSSIFIYAKLLKESNITIDILDNSNVKMVFFVEGDYNYSLTINMKKYSSLELFTSENNKGDSKIEKTINLLGIESSFKGYEYLSSNNNKITGGFYVNHLSKDTKAETSLNYLSNNNGYINRDAIATIKENMVNSNSTENIKGIILSSESRIDSKPILVISCCDVHASHGCAIGTIDDNEIYYLMSRGLTREDSLKIICKSLINPILREIKNEEFINLVKPSLYETIGE